MADDDYYPPLVHRSRFRPDEAPFSLPDGLSVGQAPAELMGQPTEQTPFELMNAAPGNPFGGDSEDFTTGHVKAAYDREQDYNQSIFGRVKNWLYNTKSTDPKEEVWDGVRVQPIDPWASDLSTETVFGNPNEPDMRGGGATVFGKGLQALGLDESGDRAKTTWGDALHNTKEALNPFALAQGGANTMNNWASSVKYPEKLETPDMLAPFGLAAMMAPFAPVSALGSAGGRLAGPALERSLATHYAYGDDAIGAIQHYTTPGMGYEINRKLKEGLPLTEQEQMVVARLDQALGQHPAPQDMTLYRGVTEPLGVGEHELKGYTSTSTDAGTAEAYSHADQPQVLKINAPKGSRGGYLDPHSRTMGESEFLLPQGAKIRVTGTEAGDGVTYHVADLLADQSRASIPGVVVGASDRQGPFSPRGAEAPSGANSPDSLPMDEGARLARAREGGFDTENETYRGLTAPYDSDIARQRPYQMFVRDPVVAGEFAGTEGPAPNVTPAYLRRGMALAVDAGGANWSGVPTAGLPEDVRGALGATASIDRIARRAKSLGYDTVEVKNVYDNQHGRMDKMSTVDVVFDPKNIRSKFAAFDPAKSGSSNLLAADQTRASIPGVVVGAADRAEKGAFESTAKTPETSAFSKASDDGDLSLASKSANIYDPPEIPQRPFEADYKDGAKGKFDEHGNLTHDMEGRELRAPFVVGRRVVGGEDQAFSPAQLDPLAEGLTGKASETLPSREIGGDAGRVTTRTDRRSGRSDYDISLSRDNTPTQAPRVLAHEVAHVIDLIAGKIDQTDIKNDLQRIYHNLNDGSWRRLKDDTPRRLQTTPESNGYSREKAPRELMAEAIRAYLANPNYIKEIAPKVAERIRKAWNEHPEGSKVVQFNADQAKASLPGVFAQAAEREGQGPFSKVPKGIGAYHASPHDFDRFDFSKIGTGEGAQAYGHGGYFAESEAVSGKGGMYDQQFSEKPHYVELASGERIKARSDRGLHQGMPAKERALLLATDTDGIDKPINRVRRAIRELEVGMKPTEFQQQGGWGDLDILRDTLKELESLKAQGAKINADPEHFLDWDKPLSKQSEAVRKALESVPNPMFEAWRGSGAWPHVKGETLYRELAGGLTRKSQEEGKHVVASQNLYQQGIPGIRYLDQGSRWKGDPPDVIRSNLERAQRTLDEVKAEPSPRQSSIDYWQAEVDTQTKNLQDATVPQTSNYVVFDDKIVEILRKYGILAPPVGAGLLGATKGEDDEG
jgi:hypothetical protein